MHCLEINLKATIILKYSKIQRKEMKIEAFLSLKNASLPPISLLDTKSTC